MKLIFDFQDNSFKTKLNTEDKLQGFASYASNSPHCSVTELEIEDARNGSIMIVNSNSSSISGDISINLKGKAAQEKQYTEHQLSRMIFESFKILHPRQQDINLYNFQVPITQELKLDSNKGRKKQLLENGYTLMHFLEKIKLLEPGTCVLE